MSLRRTRGASASVFAILLPVTLAAAAFVVDLGYARVVRGQLRAATDAAAHAAARELDGTEEGLARAREVARWVAAQNLATHTQVDLEDDDVRFGAVGDGFDDADDPAAVTAVRVVARRPALTSFFGRVIYDRDHLGVGSSSVAVRGRDLGAGRVPWYLPFALPDCLPETFDDEDLSSMVFELNPAGSDNVAWGLLDQVTSASAVRSHLDGILPCVQAWDPGRPLGSECDVGEVAQDVDLNNGVLSSALSDLSDLLPSGIPWRTDLWGPLPARSEGSTIAARDYGRVLVGPVPLFRGTADYCGGNPSWNETFEVTGFVFAIIYDVRASGPAKDKNAFVRLDMRHVYPVGTRPGGGDTGVVFTGPPVLVP